jgi:predicted enzyme related to lactoylglutathione lyase
MPDTITWFEIGTDDPAAAERFYGDVFGWTVDPGGPDPSYRFLGTGEGGLRGGLVDTAGAMPGYAICTTRPALSRRPGAGPVSRG